MKVGFVGAGKVGFSLGKMFELAGKSVTGYYSRSPHSAEEAADFTHSKFYSDINELINESDTIFLTVPDDAIEGVWDEIRTYDITDKLICHCSGSLSSEVFSDIEKTGSYGFSIHPLLAISDRYQSYRYLPQALFTIEGNNRKTDDICAFMKECGINIELIDKNVKTRYHAAAVMCSNLVVALIDSAQDELRACGFRDENLGRAVEPLISGNIKNVFASGTVNALTGPVERNDLGTVAKHLDILEGTDRDIYKILSNKLISIAKIKHDDCDYSGMEKLLED